MLIIFDLDDTLFPRLPDNYTDEDLHILQLFPTARSLLEYPDNLKKVLVTKGDPEFQMAKINILNISHLFEAIFVCSADEEKKECFRSISENFPDDEIWVFGDRIDSEIRYGNELGLKTIHLRQGKYKHLKARNTVEIPAYEIIVFSDIWKVLGLQTV